MSYRLIYSPSEVNRVIPAVLIDKRASILAISGQNGATIQAFANSQVALADGCIFYKIETFDGNLVGYFTLKVIREGVVSLLQYELRPPFQQFDSQISQIVSNFIASSEWQFDNL